MMNQSQALPVQRFETKGKSSAAHSRAMVYEFLSVCFLLEPTSERINQVMILLVQLEIDSNSFIEKMLDLPLKMTELYYERFFVPFSPKYVPPLESAIRGNDALNPKQAFGSFNIAESQWVGSCYEAAGFNPLELHLFEPLKGIQFMDHMGFELAFMSYLCYAEEQADKGKEEEKARRWQRLQYQFLSEHLIQWSDRYAELIEERGFDFYSGIVRYVAAWVKLDTEMLSMCSYH